MRFIDTHIHIDAEEYNSDREEVIARAKETGCAAVFVPAINLKGLDGLLKVCSQYPDYAYPMIGLHPEDVREDWRDTLERMRGLLQNDNRFIAIGEVGLDYYWSREFEKEQLQAFETQVKWSVETRLPLMIHCRKAQNEMVQILRRYEGKLPGGVFHCFTGNEEEARQLLSFNRFMLGIGGVLTFKKSHLPDVLPSAVPLERIVLETDGPYMAPVPLRGQRNESSFIPHIIEKVAECYGVSVDDVARQTTFNAMRLFHAQNIKDV